MNGKIFTGYLAQMLEKYGDIPLIEAVEGTIIYTIGTLLIFLVMWCSV